MRDKLFTRNFTFLILGQVSSLIGNYTLKFALSMYVLEQTGSASIFATLLAVAMLPTILLSPFGGILADRANRRNIMVCSSLWRESTPAHASSRPGCSMSWLRRSRFTMRRKLMVCGSSDFASIITAWEKSQSLKCCLSQFLM